MSSQPSSSSPAVGSLSDLAVLQYLQSRGYSSAYQALHHSLTTTSSTSPTSLTAPPLTRAVSGLLGGPAGHSLDSSVDVVFWGLAKGSGRAMVDSFDRFFECVRATPDLMILLGEGRCVVFVGLRSFGA